jgi:hypothetical protein
MAAKVSKPGDIASPGDGGDGARTHRVTLDLVPEVPPEVPVGTNTGFKVRVPCGDGIELYRRPRTTRPEPGHSTCCAGRRLRARTRFGRWASRTFR